MSGEQREYVVMWRRSVGNAETGTAWTETAIFPATATLADVEAWIEPVPRRASDTNLGRDGDVTIQVVQRPATTPARETPQ